VNRPADTRTALRAAIGVALVAFVAYIPALRNDFVNWDDDGYVTGNRHVQRLTAENLAWAFTTFHQSNWHPLTWVSHMVDCTLFGLDPAGHHATSVLLHAANAALLALVLFRMTKALAPSLLVAALFALHPLNVESVAWISERKNVLSTLFWILAVGAHARYAERPTRGRYATVAALLALGLLAKPMLVTLPLVLLLLDAWPLGRLSRRAVLEKVPLVALAAVSAVVTVAAQRAGDAVVSFDKSPLASRLANAAVSAVRYLAKAALPRGLSVQYPWPGGPEAPPLGAGVVLGAVALLVAATVLALRARARAPHLAVGWLWYLGTLVPVIGIVQVGAQAMADRYAYVPLIGVFIAVTWSLPWARAWPPPRGAAVVAAALLAALGALTVARERVWRDPETLWRTTLAGNPRSRVAHTNLGQWLLRQGKRDEAIAHFREALAIDLAHGPALVSLGAALEEGGLYDEAIARFRESIRHRPNDVVAHYNLGLTLNMKGETAAAEEALRAALVIDPNYTDASLLLGRILADSGRLDEAAAQYASALRERPDDVRALFESALVEARAGRTAEAIRRYQEVIRLDPLHIGARYNLGNVFSDVGRYDEAIANYRSVALADTGNADARFNLAVALLRKGETGGALAAVRDALRIRPDHAESHFTLGLALMRRGEAEPAIAAFREAVRLRPDYAEAHVNLGVLLAGLGRADEAIACYREAVRVRPTSVEGHNNLALALAAQGRRAEAIAAFRDGLAAAPSNLAMANALAWLLATSPEAALRKGGEAVEIAERVVGATGRRDAQALDTLAAAYAEVARFADARAAAGEAITLARAAGDAALEGAIARRLELYGRGKPYREAAGPREAR
jgi:tetratricopeptide (TPR) repeat protein